MDFINDTENLNTLKNIISQMFLDTNHKAYVVGSCVVDGQDANDVDVVLSFVSNINISEYRWYMRVFIKLTRSLPYNFNLHFNMESDNTNISDLPYYDLITGSNNIVEAVEDWGIYDKATFYKLVRTDKKEKNELNLNSFLDLKYDQVKKLENKKTFLDELIKETVETDRVVYLKTLLEGD
jgi:hypothetical protein